MAVIFTIRTIINQIMKYKSFLKLFCLGILCAFLAASCTKEGPMGPAGADGKDGIDGIAGADGKDGKDGTDGKDGVAGNQACLVCHTKAGMDALTAEYKSSGHGNPGRALGYAGARSGCMDCHSNEGYKFATVGYYPEDNLDFASTITCQTCHGDHSSLEDDITAPMRSVAAVTSKADGTTVFDFGNSSNTCAYCHQSRKNGTYYSKVDSVFNRDGEFQFAVHEDSVYLSSSHASPHYTTMTNTMFGVGGYTESPGQPMIHKDQGCVSCHMGEADEGKSNGGHTMAATLTSCTKCHVNATSFDVKGAQTEIHEAEEAVAEALVEAGILNESHGAVVGVYHKDVFEAYWNYKIVHYDGSAGVHNPAYTRALLDYAKDKLGI